MRRAYLTSVLLLLSVGHCALNGAETYFYVGPNNGSWQTAGNWTPFNPGAGFIPPPAATDTVVINLDRDVVLQNNVNALAGLVVANAGDLLTSGHFLSVNNGVASAEANIIGTGTTGNNTELFVQPNTGGGTEYGFLVDILNLENGGELDLINDSVVSVDNRLNVDAMSIITGRGTIRFEDSHGFVGRRFDLQGAIRPDAGGTITLEAESGTIDIDGQVHNDNFVDLTNLNSRLIVDGPLHDSFTGTMHLGAGSRLTMQNAWTHGPEPGQAGGASMLRLDPGEGETARIDGGHMTIGGLGDFDANVRMVSGFGRVFADTTIQSNADIRVFSNAELDFQNDLTFTGAALIVGAGRFSPGADNFVEGAVTISTDTVNFDDGDWHITQPLTLNVDTIDDVFGNWFGLTSPADRVINITSSSAGGFLIDNGRLTVNLPGNDDWTLAFDATMNITGLTGDQPSHSLAGAPLELGGTVNIDGRTRFTAPIDVRVGLDLNGQIQFADSSSSLELGADSEMSGGTIAGSGELRSTSAELVGHGTISSDVAFSGTSRLQADGGTLLITGDIDSFGQEMGTVDANSTLQIEDTLWDIADGGAVVLNGGLLTDGNTSTFVQNRGGTLIGNGLVSLNSLNNNGLIAAQGGTLEIDDRLDWDGSSSGAHEEGDGTLAANLGTLLISDAMFQGPSFVGTIEVADGQQFIYETGGGNDVILFDDITGDAENNSVGRLNMQGGTLVADSVAHRGQFEINNAPGGGFVPSTIEADEIVFGSLGTTTINAQLQLSAAVAALVEPGAQFSGTGSLSNLEDSVLIVQDQATVGVELINSGSLFVGAGALLAPIPAEMDVDALTQTSLGAVTIDIAGTALDEFDRIDALDGASLDGTISVDFLQGFEPLLGDTFEILTAGGSGVDGTFYLLDFPVFNDLTLAVNYSPQNVVLEVIEAADAVDANMDGAINGLDFLWLQRHQPGLIPLWQSLYPVGAEPLAAATTVPEPTTMGLLLLGTLLAMKNRKLVR